MNYLTGKNIFIISLIVVGLTIGGVWFFGLEHHRSLYENSFLSTSILAASFFLFLSINLYLGTDLKDDFGDITQTLGVKFPNISNGFDVPTDMSVGDGEGVIGVILAIIIWIVVSFVLVIFLWFFGAALWTLLIFLIAMLYWIYFRTLRLAFRNSAYCKGNLLRSTMLSLVYTVLYSSWIFGIILLVHYSN